MKYLILLLTWLIFASCGNGWLNVKPESSLVVPTEIKDFQALLDNSSVMNRNQAGMYGEISAGDLQVSSSSYQSFPALFRHAYIWSSTADFFEGVTDPDWRNAYRRILYSNLAIEGINLIVPDPNNQQEWNNVKGSALFYRAYDFYSLAQQYCKPYSLSAKTDLGIPLRTFSDINIPVKRATVEETYDKIITDLREALSMLPEKTTFKTRPSQWAVHALLARVYLSMADYPNALIHSNACLKLSNRLIDYSSLTIDSSYPIEGFNDEVIYQCRLGNAAPFSASHMDVVPELLNLYHEEDLRSKVFFKTSANNTAFKGSYDGSRIFFSGLATDEIILIRAESNAREGNIRQALTDLNNLLKKRWDQNGHYVEFNSTDKEQTISKILEERRKELCFRGIRWSDLRRLNQESDYKTTLERTIDGKVYRLAPNDPCYVFPIDMEEIRIGRIEQNQR